MGEAFVPNVRALATTRLSNALLARVKLKAATKDVWIVYNTIKICDLIIVITYSLMNLCQLLS